MDFFLLPIVIVPLELSSLLTYVYSPQVFVSAVMQSPSVNIIRIPLVQISLQLQIPVCPTVPSVSTRQPLASQTL